MFVRVSLTHLLKPGVIYEHIQETYTTMLFGVIKTSVIVFGNYYVVSAVAGERSIPRSIHAATICSGFNNCSQQQQLRLARAYKKRRVLYELP